LANAETEAAAGSFNVDLVAEDESSNTVGRLLLVEVTQQAHEVPIGAAGLLRRGVIVGARYGRFDPDFSVRQLGLRQSPLAGPVGACTN